jgi:hypothetical protein
MYKLKAMKNYKKVRVKLYYLKRYILCSLSKDCVEKLRPLCKSRSDCVENKKYIIGVENKIKSIGKDYC